ncbi:glucose-6-phosphate dehydrogenase [Tautonia plasticadhaerens]|uniref:Glucose-6-phosphate 1-dehydrogenase n=1 Tax=Tautonia plasticadhaerens TaxID=2527974 RepID=A0A518GUP2_9BACT|nr:glucose-6-phosphate dehydrogenase [Tautonia plasticadhaerens]QDV32310.1 Glucose-6-phosphate 1-dehydrogenase [Tautonia plasticadhaerens]
MEPARSVSLSSPATPAEPTAPGDPCILVIFGASGDLTKRLLVPSLYNLACDGLLPEQFAVVGIAKDGLTTEAFRSRMAADLRTFNTRKEFDPRAWDWLESRLHYTPGDFGDEEAYGRLKELVSRLDAERGTGGNLLFYMATLPSLFGLISEKLNGAGFKGFPGWQRMIVEKPFGSDLESARALNRELLAHWREDQIFRIDHYLGKETVQNILAFRFANELFEPLWNRRHIDHIQLTVSEAVGVEGRGGYYDRAGVLRDMIQNHMLQMLAYVCMEPPASFSADDIRDEKAKLLRAVRRYSPEVALSNAVRGQYGAGTRADGAACPAYRSEKEVDPGSNTETFAALRLFIDNWRWENVPIYLRSGKALWKRGTEVAVQFKRAPEVLFRGPTMRRMPSNRLIFHIQPDQGIESNFQAKVPGPVMQLQSVNMRFSYGESFRAERATGYEVMIYGCMTGDATLFSRTDLVEAAWQVAQPILDAWSGRPARDFPNYDAGSWGPVAANDLLERDGRRWYEVIDRETLGRVPLFRGGDPLLLNQVSMALRPHAVPAGEVIIREGDPGSEMYLICRGEAEVIDGEGEVLATLREGACFGEVALLLSEHRTATVRARTSCDLFVLDRADFRRILRDHPQFCEAITRIAHERYDTKIDASALAAAPA